jgi:hypothetical protein
MPSGASQPVEERIKGLDKFGLAGDRWHYSQIIGQKRRAAKDNGCPDRHLGLRLVIPVS